MLVWVGGWWGATGHDTQRHTNTHANARHTNTTKRKNQTLTDLHEQEDDLARDVAADAVDVDVPAPRHPFVFVFLAVFWCDVF